MPRGIDRVDLALARHFFSPDAAPAAFGILPTPWGMRAFEAERVRRGLQRLERFWAEDICAETDPIWMQLRHRMSVARTSEASLSLASGLGALSLPARISRLARVLAATGVGLGHPVRSFLPQGTAYINIGQIGLAMPTFFSWLDDRPDITSVFMLHDVIPIQYPELVAESSARHHAQMVKTTARFADGLIVSTNDAAAGIARELTRYGCDHVPTLVRSLPLNNGFTRGTTGHRELAETDYFVVCGTIEPRKNHALLIEVWKALIEREGLAAPHLVMVGTPGWSADKLFALLDHSPLLRARVHHAAGMSTPALAQLIAGSRALLVPSLAEGFSLPLLESRALGIPAIASDIPVHRERADAGVCLLPTDDCAGWLAAIDATPRGEPQRLRFVDRALSEEAYCEDIVKFVQACVDAKLGNQATGSPEAIPLAAPEMAGGPARHPNAPHPEAPWETAECA